jgi:hypothetical protein
MRTLRTILAVVCAAAAGAVALAAPAAAAPTQNDLRLVDSVWVPYLPEGSSGSTAPSPGVPGQDASPDSYPSGCGLYVNVYRQGNDIVGSALTACSSSVGYIYTGATVERSRFYGWQDMAVNADEVYNSASLAVDAAYNCSGTGTHDFRSVGTGRINKNGNIYNANAYDQINSITC